MLKHTIITGLLPQDGETLIAQLDKASTEGFVISSTTMCAISEDSAYYAATMVRVPEKPEQRTAIGMGERRTMIGPKPDVPSSPPAQHGNP
jgi:hypothetical protein